jgi:ABC-type phosphate/phosphonate transport system substrate-binding protein
MYNLPEMRASNQAFWDAIRIELERQGMDDIAATLDFARKPVPQEIERDTLFTQVCGYPLQTIYRGQTTLLAAPAYAAEHCAGATHVGAFVVHRDSSFRQLADLRGCHFVFNSRHSNSGMNLPRRSIADTAERKRFFATIEETHSQPGNVERVARGEADATCADCVTYAFFRRHRPALADLTRVLAVTRPSPSIPFVTSSGAPDGVKDCLRRALFKVGRSQEWSAVRAGLMLRDILPVDAADYAIQLRYEDEARDLGYPELA